ncbi:unnamed protein product [Blepharisma stoltei]|uniref:Iron-binding zinc finger CDGSH type domain-containing protein n=1 Tax=Blepharisma stoltei TaxID=1481888 RepID=A0AAU9KFC3_9CILI|nr:unnamed protein product [Blepharisma stoltei]
MEESKEASGENERLPRIAAPNPYRIDDLEPGKEYRYCTCGLSKTQPFCDDAHIGTEFQPITFTVERKQKMWYLCGCKHNDKRSGPFCDGSHIHLEW